MARKKKDEISNEDAQEMVDNGDAEIPAEAIVEDQKVSDYESHPKFHKFKKGNI